jgi:hypothetical protein
MADLILIMGLSENSVAPGPIATDFDGGIIRDNELIVLYLYNRVALQEEKTQFFTT